MSTRTHTHTRTSDLKSMKHLQMRLHFINTDRFFVIEIEHKLFLSSSSSSSLYHLHFLFLDSDWIDINLFYQVHIVTFITCNHRVVIVNYYYIYIVGKIA